MVESIRTVNGKTKVETRYYISSLARRREITRAVSPQPLGHRKLALTGYLTLLFRLYDCRIRKDNAPQNFAVIRHIAVNLLGKEKTKKLGTKNKQFLAAMDNDYLSKVLQCT